jgi:catechol 2,3-dioxygenase-like lactoylglutathione lyase family enzyme
MEQNAIPAIVGLAPMLPVTNVARAIKFYEQLGFRTGNTHTPEEADSPVWAWLHSSQAHRLLHTSTEQRFNEASSGKPGRPMPERDVPGQTDAHPEP